MKTLKQIFLSTTLFILICISIDRIQAQNIGINGSGANAHPSALLDVDAVATPSLGVLIPRIALQAVNIAAPVTSPAISLLVYNTASAGTGTNAVNPGFYYWDGTAWIVFNTSANTTATMPTGGIIMWSGTLGTIPSGWALCDGTLGTPDLRDKFILSVNTSENPGATGGAHSYALSTAQLPSHNHTFSGTTSSDGAHTHTAGGSGLASSLIGITNGQYATVQCVGLSCGNGYLIVPPASNITSSNGAHTHTYSGTTSSIGSGASIDNRPAYYKLAFIMKL